MNLRRNPLYLSSNGTRRNQHRHALGNFATVLFIGLVMAVNYWVFLSDDRTPLTPAEVERASQPWEERTPTPSQEPEKTQEPPLEDLPSPMMEPTGGTELAGELEKGQSLISALSLQGLDSNAMLPLIHAMESVFDFKSARVGDNFVVDVNAQGGIARLHYETSPLDRYEVSLEKNGGYEARKQVVDVAVEVEELGCPVRASLYATIRRCGEDTALAGKLVDLLAWDMDFFQDVRNGDEIRLIIEKLSVDGKFLAYRNILAAEYRGHLANLRFFWHEDSENDVADYFTEEGQSVRKEFLKTPLKYSRISSGYSHHRYHPVLHRYKQHLGIDYAAPVGSPVWAVASGKVTWVGKKGPSGNLVAVQHANGFTSYYAHLSRYARGLKVGDSVAQKSIVGFVGMTGRATGPHLHFGLKHRGRFVNPQTIKYTTANPLPPESLQRFQRETELRIEQLERIKMGDSGPLRS